MSDLAFHFFVKADSEDSVGLGLGLGLVLGLAMTFTRFGGGTLTDTQSIKARLRLSPTGTEGLLGEALWGDESNWRGRDA